MNTDDFIRRLAFLSPVPVPLLLLFLLGILPACRRDVQQSPPPSVSLSHSLENKNMASQQPLSDQERLRAFFSEYFKAKLEYSFALWRRSESRSESNGVPSVTIPKGYYKREIFERFCEGTSQKIGEGGRLADPAAPERAEFNYANWDMVGFKKTGDIWVVEHVNVRGTEIDAGAVYQHKLRELPDGSFRLIGERHKFEQKGRFINLGL